MRWQRTLALSALAVALSASLASAFPLYLNETFTYPNGDLVGQGSPAWEAHSGAGSNPVQVASGKAALGQGAGSREDVNKPLGVTLGSGGKIYAGFDFTNTGGFGDVYIAHFKDSGTINFASRVWLRAPNTSGNNFTIGVTSSSGTAANAANWASDLVFGTTYRVVHSYDFTSGLAELWLNPINQSSTSVSNTGATSNAVERYALRQATTGTGGGSPTQTIDNLCVADNFMDALLCPEPGSLALLGIGVLALLRRRR